MVTPAKRGIEVQRSPIVGASNAYQGTFDGAGHAITGLTIRLQSIYQGPFGYVGADGSISELGVVRVSIVGGDFFVCVNIIRRCRLLPVGNA